MRSDEQRLDPVADWARATADITKRDTPGPRDDPAEIEARIERARADRDRDATER